MSEKRKLSLGAFDAKLYRVKCPKCGHRWITKSERLMITCPNCSRKVKREEAGAK